MLYPNQFVNARLLVDTLHGVVRVPVAAVQRGEPGTYVYVINANNTVSVRPVKLGPTDGGMVAVDAGLRAGEKVVTDGTDRLRDGAPVQIAPPPASPEHPPAHPPGHPPEHPPARPRAPGRVAHPAGGATGGRSCQWNGAGQCRGRRAGGPIASSQRNAASRAATPGEMNQASHQVSPRIRSALGPPSAEHPGRA